MAKKPTKAPPKPVRKPKPQPKAKPAAPAKKKPVRPLAPAPAKPAPAKPVVARPSTDLGFPIFQEPVFGEVNLADFKVPADSAEYNNSQVKALLTTQVTPFNPMRGKPGDLFTLASALGPTGDKTVQAITSQKQVVFHAVGDTGASSSRSYAGEIQASDAMVADFHASQAADRPAFYFNLGDTVYNFGESQYYYEQFYDAYRNYPAPIFSIPGNHDCFVLPDLAKGAETPLQTFARNFCAPTPVITKEAGSLHRTAMTQPGVYFTLDAPFVRIIGLFSNALEDPGVISSEGGVWKTITDVQLTYLTAQLQQIKSSQYAGAVIIAVHHPPFSYTTAQSAAKSHSSSTAMLRDIDTICKAQGVYPHAFLSGHAHNYQRYTRKVTFNGHAYQVPFLVCGSGGHNVNPLVMAKGGDPGKNIDVSYLEKNPAVTSGGVTLVNYNDKNFGYLRVTVTDQQLTMAFVPVYPTGGSPDSVTVNLATHTIV